MHQAIERADPNEKNKGGEGSSAVLQNFGKFLKMYTGSSEILDLL
jgi:hypothetical protein